MYVFYKKNFLKNESSHNLKKKENLFCSPGLLFILVFTNKSVASLALA